MKELEQALWVEVLESPTAPDGERYLVVWGSPARPSGHEQRALATPELAFGYAAQRAATNGRGLTWVFAPLPGWATPCGPTLDGCYRSGNLDHVTPLPEPRETLVGIWTPGGDMVNMTIASVLQYLETPPPQDGEYLWEVREPGVAVEVSTYTPENFTPFFAEAVAKALPYWRDAGLTFAQAAFIAQTSGLIVSTDLRTADETEEEADERETE